MSTTGHDSEPDPTGVRALLSSLPDPGPMPEELVQRITASLREEQRLREQQPDGSSAPHPQVISLDAERARRRPGRVLSLVGAAAAVAVAATVATTQLFGGAGPELVTARYGADSGGADVGAADEQTAGAPEGGVGDDRDDSVLDSGPELLVLPGVLPLTRVDLAGQLRAELPTWTLSDADSPRQDSLSGEDAQNCSQSVPEAVGADSVLAVGAATLDGEDAVLLVQTRPAPATAWLLPAGCVRGPVQLLYGPLTLD